MSQELKKKSKFKRAIYIESIVIFIVALTPLFYKIYDYFPGPSHADAHNSISFLFLEIGSNGFDSVSTNLWFYTQKVIPLVLCLFWFFTSKNWWYHIIMIPIATYAFQIFELLYSEDSVIDTENIWWLLPVCMVVIPFVYLIRIKLYDKYVHGIDLDAMEEELKVLKAKKLKDKEIRELRAELPKVEYRSLSQWIDEELSTTKLTRRFTNLRNAIASTSFFKF